jgi:homoserine kinase type II
MHLAGHGFALTRENALGLSGWRPLYNRFRDGANEIAPTLRDVIEAELDHLEARWPSDIPQGVIHADLFPDNVFFIHDKLSGLIDFYFACNDSFAYDVAVCLNAWCFEQDYSFNLTKGRALLRAYDAVRPLDAGERASLPLLARGSALRFLLTRAYDWINTPANALVKRKDPLEYLRRLRFHQSIASVSEYGLDAT